MNHPKLGLINLGNLVSHSLTNFCRSPPRYQSEPRAYRRVLVNNGQNITRADAFENLAYLPTVCPILADYILSEPLLIALALLAAGKLRIETSFVRERNISRFLVRAFQGHMVAKADSMFADEGGVWARLTPADAARLLVVHSTTYDSACQIMRPYGTMQPKEIRGYLHFATANNSTTLDQMDQLRNGVAFPILHMNRVSAEFEVFDNKVGTVTLRKDGVLVTCLGRHYIQYCLNRQGKPMKARENER